MERRRRAAARRRRHRLVARTLLVGLLAVLLGATTFVTGLLAAPFDEQQVPPPPKPVLILAQDGTQIGSLRPTKRREIVPPESIPQVMRDAIIAAEDERFLEHRGVDPLSITRAFLRDVTGGQTQGGSTLTQQYVKNVYVGSDRTLTRKIREAAIAYRLEKRKSKQQILTDYLNVLFLGNGTYGVQAASRYYFGVDVRDLDLDTATGRRDPGLGLARASMLAGIAPAPSAWNPVKDMTLAKARQRYTLNRLVIDGKLSPEQAGDAYGRQLVIVKETPPPPETTAPEFADLVADAVRAKYTTAEDEDLLYRGGLRVRTTLDVTWQEAVTQAAREVLPDANDPQAAVVAIDPRNGDVKAMTTLRRYPTKVDAQGNVREATDGYQRFGFNLATDAHRSVGSTIKPFTLAEAVKQGYSLGQRRRAPGRDCLPNPGGEPNPYCYGNAGEASYGGRLTLRTALQKSVNTVFVPLANEVGRENVAQLMLAAGAKPSPAFPIKSGNLSFGLGAGVEVTPLSMANAYGTLVNAGKHVPPRFVLETRNEAGAVLEKAGDPAPKQVLPPEVADAVTDAMSGVTSGGGTAPRARQPFPVYGKTGTTNDSVDAWFIGCAREPHHLCLAVWMGFEDQNCAGVQSRSCGGMFGVNGVRQVYGGTLPAAIFARAMELHREISARKAAPPAPPPAQSASDEEPDAEPTRRARTRSPEPAPTQAEEPAPPAPAPPPAPEPAPAPEPEPEPRPTRPPPTSEGTILPAPPGQDDRGSGPEPPPDG
ncbi:MAG TPA: transglycosylase domain-containing protein [Mycobacteriales bacterium]|nr:transglycosylase domain-containing protein [Mycobacteriales bacterium]